MGVQKGHAAGVGAGGGGLVCGQGRAVLLLGARVAATAMHEPTLPILLDTDIGSDVDDALCLALAMASPEVRLVAVTTVSRDTVLRARVAKRLLELGGMSDVPVHAGEERPLAGGERFVWFGHEGKGILDAKKTAPAIDGPDALSALLEWLCRDHPPEIVAIGPLTNLAAVLRSYPWLSRCVPRITIIGGFLEEGGVEYNLCSDPDAAMEVFRSGARIRLVPLDVTRQVWLDEEDLAVLEARGGALQRALAAAMRIWAPVLQGLEVTFGDVSEPQKVAFLHDPLALACAADESFCGFEDLWLKPQIVDGLFRLERRPRQTRGSVPVRCATSVDADRFRRHVMERLCAVGR